jgi:hypothetical protein
MIRTGHRAHSTFDSPQPATRAYGTDVVIVRSERERPPRRPGWWPALGAAGLLAVALGLLAVLEGGAGPDDTVGHIDAAATMQRPPPPASSAALPGEPSHDRPVVSEILDGGLLTVVDLGPDGSSPALLMWATDDGLPSRFDLPPDTGRWALNASGELLAYTTSPAAGEGSLRVRYADGSERAVAEGVLTFAWKVGDPDRIAWTVPAFEGVRLITARLSAEAGEGRVDARVAGDIEPGVIIGWNSHGVWVERFDEEAGESTFHAYAASGRTAGVHRGDLMALHPDGERLLIGRRLGGFWMLFEAGRGLAFERIEWSLDGVEVIGGVWSHADPDRIALFGFEVDTSQWWIAVWDTAAGHLVHRLDIPYRILDVAWSHDDRLLVVSVSDDRGRSAVLAVDARSLVAHEIVFDDVVLAAVVPVPGAMVTVPEVTGFPLGRALAALGDAGLQAVVDDAFAARGLAVTQQPAPGTKVPAGSDVRVGVARPVSSSALDIPPPDVPDGNAECSPESPTSPGVLAGVSRAEITEVRGSGDFEMWGLVLAPLPWRTDRHVKMVVRIEADSDHDPIFLARHPARRVAYSRWGPFLHDADGSGWDRPGQEWGIAFVLREPGCWTIRVVVGFEYSDFYIRVW